jgi:hypothetical protein
VVGPRYADGGGIFVAPDGSRYVELSGWLEPDEVRRLVERGALVFVDWCADGWDWDAELNDSLLARVVSGSTSHRYARPKYAKTPILAPSLWRRENGTERLVILSEENPKRRKVLAELRRPFSIDG